MRTRALPVRVTSAVGEVRVGNDAVQAGAALAEGQSLQTGAERLGRARAGRRLAGARAAVQPGRDRRQPRCRARPTPMRSAWPATAGSPACCAWCAARSRCWPPSCRRAAAAGGDDAHRGGRRARHAVPRHARRRDSGATRSEVLEGRVQLESPQRSVGTDIAAGFGAAHRRRGRARRCRRSCCRRPTWPRCPSASSARWCASRCPPRRTRCACRSPATPSFEQASSTTSSVAAGSDVRIAGLADARWYLRARRLDGQGIEGYDAVRPFVLKARPEPPATEHAARRAPSSRSGRWSSAGRPTSRRRACALQVARDAAFPRHRRPSARASPARARRVELPAARHLPLAPRQHARRRRPGPVRRRAALRAAPAARAAQGRHGARTASRSRWPGAAGPRTRSTSSWRATRPSRRSSRRPT